MRQELGLSMSVSLVGLIARFHPVKAHEVFLEAAELLLAQHHDVHFVLTGNGVDPGDEFFQKIIPPNCWEKGFICLAKGKTLPS